ncbi:MAG: hypothetical protein JWM32_1082 [Verrucomicrobia bacterium]|nr:hypothetical protein [Verrucomicrobiota bacterium]
MFRCVLVLLATAFTLRGEDESTAKPHAPSAQTLNNVSAGLPKFDPKKAATSTAFPGPVPEPAPTAVFVLPKFIVREAPPISEKDVTTDLAREDAIVKRYVGTPSDLDVALNRFTINTAWKKIPFLGRVSDFASMTYKQRVAEDYKKIEARRKFTEALGVSADVPPTKAQADNEKK